MKFQEIIDTTKKVWEKKDDAVEISRGWMAHHQVIAAALETNGENEYLSKKRGLDFGIRNNFCANADNSGVVKLSDIDHRTNNLNGNQQDRNVRQRRQRCEIKPLKYKVPSILELKKGHLTYDEIGFFREHLDPEKWTTELWNIGKVFLAKSFIVIRLFIVLR